MKKLFRNFLVYLLTILFIFPINQASAFVELLIYEDAKLTISNTIIYGTQNDASFSFAGALSGPTPQTNVGLGGFSHKIVYKYADGSEYREEILLKEVPATGKNSNNFNIYTHNFKLDDTQDAIIIFDQIDVGINIRPGVPNDEPNGDWSSINKNDLGRTSFGYNKTATLNSYTVNFVELGNGKADSLNHNISLLNVDTFDKIEALISAENIDSSLGWEAKVNGEWVVVTTYESVFFTQSIAENNVITLRPFSPYTGGSTVYLEVNYKSAFGHECYQTTINVNSNDVEMIKYYATRYVESNIVHSLNHSLLLTFRSVDFVQEHYRNPSITFVYNCNYDNAYFGETIPIHIEVNYESSDGPQVFEADVSLPNLDLNQTRDSALDFVKNQIVPFLEHSPSLIFTDVQFVGEVYNQNVTFIYNCSYQDNAPSITPVHFEINYESANGHACYETDLEIQATDPEQLKYEALEFVKNQIVPFLEHSPSLMFIDVQLIGEVYNQNVTYIYNCNYQDNTPSITPVHFEINYESANGHACYETDLEILASNSEQLKYEALEFVKNQVAPYLEHYEVLDLVNVLFLEEHHRNPTITFVYECEYIVSAVYVKINYKTPDGYAGYTTIAEIQSSDYEQIRSETLEFVKNQIALSLDHAKGLALSDVTLVDEYEYYHSTMFVYECNYLFTTVYLEVNYESPTGHKCFESSMTIDASSYEEAKQKAYDYILNEIAPNLEHTSERVVDDFIFIEDHDRNPTITLVYEFSYQELSESDSSLCKHDFNLIEGIQPTKDNPGTKSYYYCTKCGIRFYYGKNDEEIYFDDLRDIQIDYVEVIENEDGKIEAVIPENTVNSSIESAKEENGVIKVEINVYDAIDKDLTITDVTLSEESITSILESVQGSESSVEVVIDIGNATVVLDSTTLSTANKIEGNKTLSVNVDYKYNHLSDLQKNALKGKDLKLSISASWIGENGDYISDFEGGSVTIMLNDFKPENDKKLQDYTIVYISDEGKLTIMPSFVDREILCFVTGHFSEFGVMAKDEANVLIMQQTLQYIFPYIIIALVLLLAIIIIIVAKKKHNKNGNSIKNS